MKKSTAAILCALCLSLGLTAGVSVDFNRIDGELWRFRPNVTRQLDTLGTTITQYRPWQIEIVGRAVDTTQSGWRGSMAVCSDTSFGAWRDAKYTPKERYLFIKNANGLNIILANTMKAMYINAIGFDISE